MLFNEVLRPDGIIEGNYETIERNAVRAIVLKNDHVLMLQSRQGDYKLPGGGVEKNENHIDAIKREVREETGYQVTEVSDQIGQVFEQKIDQFGPSSVFEMTSYYYLCTIDEDIRLELQLTQSELNLSLTPKWVSLGNAIKTNNKLLNDENKDINSWVFRETLVLKLLKKHLKDV